MSLGEDLVGEGLAGAGCPLGNQLELDHLFVKRLPPVGGHPTELGGIVRNAELLEGRDPFGKERLVEFLSQLLADLRDVPICFGRVGKVLSPRRQRML